MSLGSLFDAALVVTSVSHLLAVGWLSVGTRFRRRLASPAAVGFGVYGAGGLVAGLSGFCSSTSAVLVASVTGAAVSTIYASWSRHHRPEGAVVWISFILLGATLAVWGVNFLANLSVSWVTRSLLFAATAMSALTVPSSVLQSLEGWEVLLRARWARPKDPLVGWMPGEDAPMVSIHVPAHAEPPELVISTLDRLAQLNYPNFEVLLIDNNTTDRRLWEPVQNHCELLGPRFRFLHVEGISGAKAGALNWALPFTNSAAELIGVVDADYHVERDWLAHTVGYFDDPTLGFVQCPHAYRDYQDSRFGRMANTEYSVFFATSMVALSEHGAGLTVGTMSLIRKDALMEVGGWAEWCLTEDSELAIRLHAAGYGSVYLSRPYGRGLIPETFAGYKKQRFRWTYGPVQEFRHHASLYMPGRRRITSALNQRQRLHHANHGLDIAMIGLRLLVVPIGLLAVASMIWHHEIVPLPGPLWAAATSVLVTSWAMRWLVYRRAVGATVKQALGATLAYLALTHVISVASALASLGRSAAWQRTDKFRISLSGGAVVRTVLSELVLGAACIILAAASLVTFPHRGLTLALALAVAWQGLTYLAAPVMAVIAERDVRRHLDVDHIRSTSAELTEVPA